MVVKEIGFDSLDGKGDDEYNDIGFVKISEICAMQDAFLFGTEPTDLC